MFLFRIAFFLTILGLFYLAQHFWFRRGFLLARRIQSDKVRLAVKAALVSAAVFLILVILDRIFLRSLPKAGAGAWIVSLVQLWLFASFFAFLLIEAVRLIEWIWLKASGFVRRRSGAAKHSADEPADVGRRTFFRYSAYAVGSVPLIAGAYGFADERWDFTVHHVEIPVANLPPQLDGFRVVQLSDIHISDFMPRDQVRRAVNMANELNAHMACSTGDLLTGRGDPIEACVAELSRLRTPLGVWGCNGNHEIYADAQAIAQELFAKYGMTLLRQQSRQIEWNGAKFNLIGVDYQRDHGEFGPLPPMLDAIEGQVRRDMPNILMSHNPNSFYRAAELGIELSLAGHTHGGQIRVEIVDHSFSPANFMTDFIAGLYQLPMSRRSGENAALYVNRGLGTIGIPARIGVPPEITLMTLRASKNGSALSRR